MSLLCFFGFHRQERRYHNSVGCARCKALLRSRDGGALIMTCPAGCSDCRRERAEYERRIALEVS